MVLNQVAIVSRRSAMALIMAVLLADLSVAQVRSKRPDRGTYRSPVLEPVDVEPIGEARTRQGHKEDVVAVGRREVALVKPGAKLPALPTPADDEQGAVSQAGWESTGEIWVEAPVLHDSTCDGCDACSGGCDSLGCDSLGPCDGSFARSWANSSLSFAPGRWFGGVELLLMFRKGDRLPPLVTTGPDTDQETAGRLDQADTEVLFGGRVLHELQPGGRFTLGTWIDPDCCRSLVLRGWFAGEETAGFSANQDQFPVLTRPFLNVSDDQAAEPDTQIVAFPDRATGSISVRASSEVFGADISARQLWYSRFGGTIDVLYGYQYMRLNEDLSISSTSVNLDEDFPEVGSVLAIDEEFDVENEFHGGQFGFASRYREGCWSFHSLIKVAFGALDRRVRLAGEQLRSVGGNNVIEQNGLLVRQTNAGSSSDHTFGWVPELDLTLGWQRYKNFDVTFGYNVIAMTDAIQVSGVIDPALAVNLSEPPLGDQSPRRVTDYRTFYVQGIHFGLRYVY